MESNNDKLSYRPISDGDSSAWYYSGGIDEMTSTGCFILKYNHENADVGLPMSVCKENHYINAILIVTESGMGDNLQKNRFVGQTLILPQCYDGKTHLYTRTLKCADNLWMPWTKIQQNREVGLVTSLDTYIDSGVYCGTYTDDPLCEAFAMVVIDNEVTASTNGYVRSVSQFKYSLNLCGTFSYRVRTGQGNNDISWGEWVDIGAADTTDIQDYSITAQKLSNALQEQINKSAYGAYWTSGPNAVTLNINKNDGTVGWQTLSAVSFQNAGVMTADDKKGLIGLSGVIFKGVSPDNQIIFDSSCVSVGDVVTFKVDKTYSSGAIVFYADDGNKIGESYMQFVNGTETSMRIPEGFSYALRIYGNTFAELIVTNKSVLQKCQFVATDDSVSLEGKEVNGQSINIPIPAATENNAGVLSCEDKKVIEEVRLLPSLSHYHKNIVNPKLKQGGYIKYSQTINSPVGFDLINTAGYSNSGYIEVEAETQYVISFLGIHAARYLCFCDENKLLIQNWITFNSGMSFTTPATCKYIIFTTEFNNSGITDIQVEKGTTPTYYIPYNQGYWGYDALPADLEDRLDNKEKVETISIANSDKIAFFSNSFLNGYCMKGKHALDNISMWSDYLFYNFGHSGDSVLKCLDRINSNEKWLGDVPVQEWGLRYGVIAMQDNDGGLYNANKETYYENFKKVAESIKAMGATPILGTEHDYNGFYYGLNKLADEQGYMFMNWGKVATALFNNVFAPFWYNGHPATRTHWMWTYGMKRYLDTLPRPTQSIKLFRVRPETDTEDLQNLVYTDNISRARRFMEIENGASVLTDDTEKYFDRLNAGGSYVTVKNEYQTLQAKTASVNMGSHALVECVTPYDRNNVGSLVMNIEASGVASAYIKKNLKLTSPLLTGSVLAFGVSAGTGKLVPGTTFTVTGGVFNDNILGTYTIDDVMDNVVITTTDAAGKTVSGTDVPVIDIDGVTLTGSYKYPTAEYLQRMKLPLGEWLPISVGTTVDLTDYLADCMDFDKVSVLLVGSDIMISDLSFDVQGKCKKVNYGTGLVEYKRGEQLLTDTMLDDGTSWLNIDDITKYTPVVDYVSGNAESLPKGVTTVRVLKEGEALSQGLKVESMMNKPYENCRLQVRVIARYFPDYIDSDSKWQNSIVRQGSYDCATMSVRIGDNATTISQEVGLYWNLFMFDIDYFGGNNVEILCESKSLHIANVEVILL